MKKQTHKKIFNVAMATTLAAGALVAVAPSQADAAESFKDVSQNNVHYADIMELASRGVVGGYTDGTYRPGKSVTRGEAAKIIAGVLELNVTSVKNPNFKDVPTTNVYYNYIAALVEAGVINGFEDNTYRSNATLTRGQMAKIIAYGFGLKASSSDNPFNDIDQSIYKESIIALFDNGVTTGKTATTYGASDQVTRAQLASFVIRAEKAAASAPTPPGEEEPVTPVTPPVDSEPVSPTPPVDNTPVTPPTITEQQKQEFIQTINTRLSSLTVPGIDNISSTGTAVTITASSNITKAQLASVSNDVITSFMGAGTTAVLDSVKVGASTYTPTTSTEDLNAIAVDLAVVLGVSSQEAVAILELDPTTPIWTAMTNTVYAGSIELNFKDGTTTPVTVTLTKGQ